MAAPRVAPPQTARHALPEAPPPAKTPQSPPKKNEVPDPKVRHLFLHTGLPHATRSRTPRPLSASTTTVSPSCRRPSMMSAESGSSTWSISVRLSERTP